MGFRYEHPPLGPGRRGEAPRLSGPRPVGPVGGVDADLASERHGEEDARLMRVRRVAPDEAERQRNAWLAEGGAHLVDTPTGVHAWERRRRDAAVPGGWRRLRLAVAQRERDAVLVYWSVPDPPPPREEERWQELISRLVGRGGDTGWLA